MHIPKKNRSKLDEVSWQGIFVGYHSSNQYRIFNPERRKVEWHTSVKFLEGTPGDTLLGERNGDKNSELLMHLGTFDDDGNSSDNEDTSNQPNSDQVGASENDQNQTD